MRVLASLLLCLLPLGAMARSDPGAQARDAMVLLEDATAQLQSADSARDRVRALTAAISALEEGLTALRSGLRQVAVREAHLSARLQAQNEQIASLLVVLQRVGTDRSPVALLHPAGPTGTARAGMLLSEVTPALSARAAELRRDVQQMTALRQTQTDAADKLSAGLRTLQDARTALNQAIAERTDLPKRFVNDPVREAILIASAETLAQFAAGLDRIAVDQIAAAPEELAGQKGSLPLPVQGILLRAADEPDAAGIARPGIILATLPDALVTAPVAATIRYIGPLLDYGQVVILEPQAGVLFVLAGLDTVYGGAGEVVDAQAPLGLMGSDGTKNATDLSTDGDETGADRSETLYIEVRRNNTPEDPSLWFRMDKNG